ncbi:MAG TPA: chromosomal replication initiator protein DnaA [Candidatus Protoclostridium stercorigallinarum]|uniref:Chromosomal replication initiator protein DnaA n=1 Tax=Candidatus Protoclostridium stercorigallinarum TaxID=2838741 RepID=A0A9D1Q0X8_9FIRM|nr:chromosomal replication initiator protein DnaA [Candidatus Protoclostridium stercorigallinarum]
MKSAHEIWRDMLTDLETEFSAVSFDVWIKTLVPYCVDDKSRLVLIATNSEHKHKVNAGQKIPIKLVAQKVAPYLTDIVVIEESEKEDYSSSVPEDTGKEEEQRKEALYGVGTPINPRYNFEEFVVGKSNELTVAAAHAVSDAPGHKFNPLFIYGASGLGKTHVMHAIGNSLLVSHPELKVIYVTSEKFLNDFISSIGNSKESRNTFRDKYRSADVLMIDDVQLLSGKERTQEELFHTFNDMHDAGKQLVFTSDRTPGEIPDISDRLRSRFEWGLITDIQPPDIETRIVILKKKSQKLQCNIPLEVLTFMAEKIDSNIREMESLLNKVVFLSGLTGAQPSVELVRDALKDYRNVTEEKINPDVIIDCVCKYFGLGRDVLLGKKKNKEIVEPRQICMYLIADMTNMPLETVGNICGGRDHTTVMHARDKIERLMSSASRIKTAVEDIRSMVFKK